MSDQGKELFSQFIRDNHNKALERETDIILSKTNTIYDVFDRMRDISRFARGEKNWEKKEELDKYEVFSDSYAAYPEIYARLVELRLKVIVKEIASYLFEIASKLPDNIHNTREVVEELYQAADSGDIEYLTTMLSIGCQNINSSSKLGGPTFIQQDIDEAWEEGYETGYKKAVETIGKTLSQEEVDRLEGLPID